MEKREVPQVASQRVYRMSAPEPRANAPPASGSATGAPMRAPRRSCRRPAPAAQSQHIQEEQLRAALAGDATRVQAQLTRAAKLRRGKSQLSLAALNTLCDLSDKLDGYEMQVETILRKASAPGVQIGAIKADLGQLYGNIDKMLNCQIDAVSTAELNSGKDDARALRKEICLRAQKTLDKIEDANSSLHI